MSASAANRLAEQHGWDKKPSKRLSDLIAVTVASLAPAARQRITTDAAQAALESAFGEDSGSINTTSVDEAVTLLGFVAANLFTPKTAPQEAQQFLLDAAAAFDARRSISEALPATRRESRSPDPTAASATATVVDDAVRASLARLGLSAGVSFAALPREPPADKRRTWLKCNICGRTAADGCECEALAAEAAHRAAIARRARLAEEAAEAEREQADREQALADAAREAAAKNKKSPKKIAGKKVSTTRAATRKTKKKKARDKDEDDESDEDDDDDDDEDEEDDDADDDADDAADEADEEDEESEEEVDPRNPRDLLDYKKWPELSRENTGTELQNALRIYYVGLSSGGGAFEAKFVWDILLSQAAALRADPPGEVRRAILATVRRAIGRLEFLNARLSMPAGAAAVETTLLDENLPPELRKARRKAREAQRDADKDKAARTPTKAGGRGGGNRNRGGNRDRDRGSDGQGQGRGGGRGDGKRPRAATKDSGN